MKSSHLDDGKRRHSRRDRPFGFMQADRQRPAKTPFSLLFYAIALTGILHPCAHADDPLPSWNAGTSKAAIVGFVSQVTRESSPTYVPPAERIAVFDNDGTLWPENPVPFELAFVIDRVKVEAAQHPEWKTTQPFRAVLENDLAGLVAQGKPALVQLLLATHSGRTMKEFEQTVRDWIMTAKHPRFGCRYVELTYQPMQELLTFLRANGFKTFIVSGGTANFMRVWAEETYGIPPEQIVGSMFKTKYELNDGRPQLVIQPEVIHINDKAGKPVGIHQVMGRRPIAAFGNSDGDLQMLEWTTIGRKPSLGLIVHHTDADREWAYDKAPKSSGKLNIGLAEAPPRGWTLVDMKQDWKILFEPFDSASQHGWSDDR